MSFLADVIAAVREWSEWKKVAETPARIDALEKRLAELEKKLQRAPGSACPSCGALAFRIERSEQAQGALRHVGARLHYWVCKECGYTDKRTETPK